MRIEFTDNTYFKGLKAVKGSTATSSIAVQYPGRDWDPKYGSQEGFLGSTKMIEKRSSSPVDFIATYKEVYLLNNSTKKLEYVGENFCIRLKEDEGKSHPGRLNLKFADKELKQGNNARIFQKILEKIGPYFIKSIDVNDSKVIVHTGLISSSIMTTYEFKGQVKTLKEVIESDDWRNCKKIILVEKNLLKIPYSFRNDSKNEYSKLNKLFSVIQEQAHLLDIYDDSEIERIISNYLLNYISKLELEEPPEISKDSQIVDSKDLDYKLYIKKNYFRFNEKYYNSLNNFFKIISSRDIEACLKISKEIKDKHKVNYEKRISDYNGVVEFLDCVRKKRELLNSSMK